MRKILRDKQEPTFPQKLKHDIISQFSCAEIRLQVIRQCTSTTFLHHPFPPHFVPWHTNPATKSVEQGGSVETVKPSASGGCGPSQHSHSSRVTMQAAGPCMLPHSARKPKHCGPAPHRFLAAGSLVAMRRKAVPGDV